MFKRLIFFVTVLLLASACNNYERLLKSTDFEKKYEAAVKFYEEEEYDKAYPLLEELNGLFRGTDRAEKVYYYFAWSNYHLGDYIMAAYHFKNFVRTYPASKYAEECLYMNALCHYHNSPEYSLDQSATASAISEFQLFVDRYPSSERVKEANDMIDKLRNKLEKKAYEQCQLFFKTENYQSAIVAVKNTLAEFPGTKYAEELSFLALESQYLFAINSIDNKKTERVAATLEAYRKFMERYPQSSYAARAKAINTSATRMQEVVAYSVPRAAYRRGSYKEAYLGYSSALYHYPENPLSEETAYLMVQSIFQHGEQQDGFEKLSAYEQVGEAYTAAQPFLKSDAFRESTAAIAKSAEEKRLYWRNNLAGWFASHRQYENAIKAATKALDKPEGLDTIALQQIIIESNLSIARHSLALRDQTLQAYREAIAEFTGLDAEFRKEANERYEKIYLSSPDVVNTLINRREYDEAIRLSRKYYSDEGLKAFKGELATLLLKAHMKQITREKDPARATRRWEIAQKDFEQLLPVLNGDNKEKGLKYQEKILKSFK